MSLIYLNRSEQEKSVRAGLADSVAIKTFEHFRFTGKDYKDRNPVWEKVDSSGRQDGGIPQVILDGHSVVVIDTTY